MKDSIQTLSKACVSISMAVHYFGLSTVWIRVSRSHLLRTTFYNSSLCNFSFQAQRALSRNAVFWFKTQRQIRSRVIGTKGNKKRLNISSDDWNPSSASSLNIFDRIHKSILFRENQRLILENFSYGSSKTEHKQQTDNNPIQTIKIISILDINFVFYLLT